MEQLIDKVSAFVGRKHHAGTDWYDWRFDPAKVPAGVLGDWAESTSWYDRNVDLKERLCQAWGDSDPVRRAALERYYIGGWGGVRTNRPATLEAYHGASAEENVARGEKGIASWSKALCVRDHLKYAIFDARVAASLNALQVIHRTAPEEAVRFPILASRNKTVSRGNTMLRDHARAHAWPGVRAGFYTDYLTVCQAAGARLGKPGAPLPVYAVEMALFAHTEELLIEAFPA
jgi:hypothetical protein